MEFYKYQGAGNDFLIADNREGKICLTVEQVAALCERRYGIGADGLMLLEKAEGDCGFRMVYYNSDGSSGMMCGNGGRCIVAFADFCGIENLNFIAADGVHRAEIVSRDGECKIVRLSMNDVKEMKQYDDDNLQGCFLNTGTRHFVTCREEVDSLDVESEGRQLRFHPEFQPEGTNVNFISGDDRDLCVRTFEKGVEAETYACGTGITASAIVAWHMAHPDASYPQKAVCVPVHALRDDLQVEFVPTVEGASDVWLIGPATLVARVFPVEKLKVES